MPPRLAETAQGLQNRLVPGEAKRGGEGNRFKLGAPSEGADERRDRETADWLFPGRSGMMFKDRLQAPRGIAEAGTAIHEPATCPAVNYGVHSMSPVVVAVVAALASASADAPREIDGSRTIHGAEVSARLNPIPARYVYGADRDWTLRPYRLAAVLVEFQDRKHEDVHTAAMYDRMLFSRDAYHETPGGDVSFGSVADWYRVQSHDRLRPDRPGFRLGHGGRDL